MESKRNERVGAFTPKSVVCAEHFTDLHHQRVAQCGPRGTDWYASDRYQTDFFLGSNGSARHPKKRFPNLSIMNKRQENAAPERRGRRWLSRSSWIRGAWARSSPACCCGGTGRSWTRPWPGDPLSPSSFLLSCTAKAPPRVKATANRHGKERSGVYRSEPRSLGLGFWGYLVMLVAARGGAHTACLTWGRIRGWRERPEARRRRSCCRNPGGAGGYSTRSRTRLSQLLV